MKEQGFIPVVPPKKNRKQTWKYDKELYKRRNEIERYFCRLKRFRKVFTRYDKLDIIFISVIQLAMIFDALLMWTRPKVIGKLNNMDWMTIFDEKKVKGEIWYLVEPERENLRGWIIGRYVKID